MPGQLQFPPVGANGDGRKRGRSGARRSPWGSQVAPGLAATDHRAGCSVSARSGATWQSHASSSWAPRRGWARPHQAICTAGWRPNAQIRQARPRLRARAGMVGKFLRAGERSRPMAQELALPVAMLLVRPWRRASFFLLSPILPFGQSNAAIMEHWLSCVFACFPSFCHTRKPPISDDY